MKKEELFEKFKELFPNHVSKVVSYKKIGVDALAITFKKQTDVKFCENCNFSIEKNNNLFCMYHKICIKRFGDCFNWHEHSDSELPVYSRVFLYIGPDNWEFGTKLYRKRPKIYNKTKTVSEGVRNV